MGALRLADRLAPRPLGRLEGWRFGATVGREFLFGRVELAHALRRVHFHRQHDSRTQQQTLRRGFGDKLVFGLQSKC